MALPWWWSTIGVPIVAYVSGIVTKPVTESLTNRFERRRLRIALQQEMRLNCRQMGLYSFFLDEVRTERPRPLGHSMKMEFADGQRREVYQHALQDSMLFHETGIAEMASAFYTQLDTIKAMPRDQHSTEISKLFLLLRMHVRRGDLPERMLSDLWLIPLVMRLKLASSQHPRWRRLLDFYSKAIQRNVPPKPQYCSSWVYDPAYGYLKAILKGIPGVPVAMDTDGFRSDITYRTKLNNSDV